MFWAPAGGAWGLCFLSCVLRMYLGYATFTKYMFYSTCSSVLYAEAERGLPRRKCFCDRIYVCSSLGRLFHLALPRRRLSCVWFRSPCSTRKFSVLFDCVAFVSGVADRRNNGLGRTGPN